MPRCNLGMESDKLVTATHSRFQCELGFLHGLPIPGNTIEDWSYAIPRLTGESLSTPLSKPWLSLFCSSRLQKRVSGLTVQCTLALSRSTMSNFHDTILLPQFSGALLLEPTRVFLHPPQSLHMVAGD